MLFLKPARGFSWLFLTRVAIDDGNSQLGCVEGNSNSDLVSLGVTRNGYPMRGSSPSASSFFLSHFSLLLFSLLFFNVRGPPLSFTV